MILIIFSARKERFPRRPSPRLFTLHPSARAFSAPRCFRQPARRGIKRAARFCSCMLLTTQSSGRMIEALRRTNGLACRPERFSNAYKRFCRRVKTHGGKAGMRPRRRFYCLALCLSQTISTATSAGETPGMRDACPRETGRWTVSFWRASRRSASMCI